MNRRHFLSVVAGAAVVPAPVQMPALSIGGGWYRGDAVTINSHIYSLTVNGVSVDLPAAVRKGDVVSLVYRGHV